MPNIEAARKSLRTDARKRVFNDRRRRAMRENIKAFKKLVEAKKADEAKALLPTVYKTIDKAAKNYVLKVQTANRKKSRLTQMLAKLTA